LHRCSSKMVKTAAIILIIITLSSFLLFSIPHAYAEETKITTLYPIEGRVYVGDTIRILGKIAEIGNYTVFFGNSTHPELVKLEKNTTTETIDASFTVPDVFGSELVGNYTVRLRDSRGGEDSRTVFIKTKWLVTTILPEAPNQLQQGSTVSIWVNVTGASRKGAYTSLNLTLTTPNSQEIYFNHTLSLSITNYGNSSLGITYPRDFSTGAHTNYTGTYTLKLLNSTNLTLLAQSTFIIGLTNATEYHRYDTINIHAEGYPPNAQLELNITIAGEEIYKNTTLLANPLGILDFNWTVPKNASIGIYTVKITNATTKKDIKPVSDFQQFRVPGFSTSLIARNLLNEPVPGVSISVWEVQETQNVSLGTKNTDATGRTIFTLEIGIYMYNASWEGASIAYPIPNQVIEISKNGVNATGNWDWNITCRLSTLEIKVIDGKTGEPLPFIQLELNYTYTNITGYNVPVKKQAEINVTGFTKIRNLITEINYTINASRYGYAFNWTTFHLPTQPLYKLNITCPVYVLSLYVLESHGYPLKNAYIEVNEWTMGTATPTDSGSTSDYGFLNIECTFGKYNVRVYESIQKRILLNETTIYLIQNPTDVTIHCKLYNLTLTIKVVDYFDQPLPNIIVELRREGIEYFKGTTNKEGIVSFPLNDYVLIGGNYRVSVLFAEGSDPIQAITLYLDKSQNITLKVNKYVLFMGTLLETSQLAVVLLALAILLVLLSALVYKKIFRRKKEEKET